MYMCIVQLSGQIQQILSIDFTMLTLGIQLYEQYL